MSDSTRRNFRFSAAAAYREPSVWDSYGKLNHYLRSTSVFVETDDRDRLIVANPAGLPFSDRSQSNSMHLIRFGISAMVASYVRSAHAIANFLQRANHCMQTAGNRLLRDLLAQVPTSSDWSLDSAK